MQIEAINEVLKMLLTGEVSLEYYQIENLPPILRYYIRLVEDAFNRELRDYVTEELSVNIQVKFEEIERMKVELISYENCYNDVLGRHRYAHVVLPRIICDDGDCVDLRKVKVVDVEGKIKEIELPQISFYVRQPIREIVEGRKKIRNRYGRMKVILRYWAKGARFHAKIFDIYVVLRGHALARRKDRLFVKKTRIGKVKAVEQKTKEGLFLEVFVVRELKLKKEDLQKMMKMMMRADINGIIENGKRCIREYHLPLSKILYRKILREKRDGDIIKIFKIWRYYNRVYRKKSGKERRILKVFLKRPERRKAITFGNQSFLIERKSTRYKYVLRNMAQHKDVKEYVLTWNDRPLNHKIVSNKPIDIYEEPIVVNGEIAGKRWIIGAKENGVEIDIYNYHHMEQYTRIHATLNANDVLVVIHRSPRA